MAFIEMDFASGGGSGKTYCNDSLSVSTPYNTEITFDQVGFKADILLVKVNYDNSYFTYMRDTGELVTMYANGTYVFSRAFGHSSGSFITSITDNGFTFKSMGQSYTSITKVVAMKYE